MRIARFVRAAAVGALALWAGGCVQSGSGEQVVAAPERAPGSARFISEQTLGQITPGTTTFDWVRSRLGEPTTVDQVRGQPIRLMRYEYEVIQEGGQRTYHLLPAGNAGRIARAIHFEVSAGIVQRMWIE